MGYGLNIKAARKAAGLTQEQLAKKCGIATVTVGQYERGARVPRAEQLQSLADALNVHVLELMGVPTSAEFEMSFDLKADRELLSNRISAEYGLSIEDARSIVDECFQAFQRDGKHIEGAATLLQLFEQLPAESRQEALNYANYLWSKEARGETGVD